MTSPNAPLVEFVQARLDEEQGKPGCSPADVAFKRFVLDLAVKLEDDYYEGWIMVSLLPRMARQWSEHPEYRAEEWNCGAVRAGRAGRCIAPVGHDVTSGEDPAHEAPDGSRWRHHRDFMGPGQGIREWDEEL